MDEKLNFREFFVATPLSDEMEVVNLYRLQPDIPIKNLAAQSGRSVAEIYRILARYHVKPNRLKHNHQQVVSFGKSGLSVKQIAGLTGYTPRNIRYILNKNES